MSIYRIKDSRYWQFDFQLDGYRFSGSTKCTNKREAQAYEDTEKAKARDLVAIARRASGEPLRLGDACDRWWNEVGAHGSERDLFLSLQRLKDILGPRTFLHEIKDNDLSRLVAERRQDRIRAGRDDKGAQLWRPITNRTVNKTATGLLQRIFARAVENWDAVIPKQPKWKNHRLPTTKRPIREIKHAEEALIDAQQDEDYAALRRFAIITGLRKRNLLLTWMQVDFEQATVTVIAKGGIPRIVPLTKEAYAILWSRRGHHSTHVFTFKAQRTKTDPKTKAKFIRGQRYPVTYYGLTSHWRRAVKRADVKARFHDIRHTTGTRLLRATGNLKLAQKLLGHSDIKTTAEFYADVLVEDIRAGMEATDAATQRHIADQKSQGNPQGSVANADKPLKGNIK
jgi:integrase